MESKTVQNEAQTAEFDTPTREGRTQSEAQIATGLIKKGDKVDKK